MQNAELLIAYLQGYWTGLKGCGTEFCEYPCFTNQREQWILGLDDGLYEFFKENDAPCTKQTRSYSKKKKKLRVISKYKPGQRYIDAQLAKIRGRSL